MLAHSLAQADDPLVFLDREQFIQATSAKKVSLPYADVGAAASFVSGPITFQAISPSTFNISQWTATFDGLDIALNDKEDLNIIADSPVYALGVEFEEATGSTGLSTFTITAKLGTDVVDQILLKVFPGFEYNFIGLWSPLEFDRLEIRESTSVNENEFFGAVYRSLRPTDHVRKVRTTEAQNNNDHFGFAVAITGDQALVGEPYDTLGLGHGSVGSAGWLERQPDGSWIIEDVLYAGDTDAEFFALFGHAVALVSDLAVVGSPDASNGDGVQTGTAYVFDYVEVTGWVRSQRLEPQAGTEFGNFGHSVAIDDDQVLISARRDGDPGAQSGAVFVFERQPNDTWLEVQKIQSGDISVGHEFGTAVVVDEGTMAISAPGAGASGKGAVYLFERQPNGSWLQIDQFAPGDTDPAIGLFGSSLDLDGELLAVGAQHAEGGSGRVFLYRWSDSTETWLSAGQVHSHDPGIKNFGSHLALSGDHLLIGATETGNFSSDTGLVCYFRRRGGQWRFERSLTPLDGAKQDQFGTAIDIEGNTVLIGSPGDDDLNDWSGAVYPMQIDRLFEIYGGVFKSGFESEPD